MKCFNVPFRIRLHGLRIFYAFVLVTGTALVALLLFARRNSPTQFRGTQFRKSLRVKYVNNVGNTSVACRLPSLDPFHESVLKFVDDLGRLQCEGASFSSFENNLLRVEGEGIVSAQYRKIGRPSGDDFNVLHSHPVPVPNVAKKETDEKETKDKQYSTGM